MRVNENGQYVSDDGFWVWDGAAWVPADGSATADTGAASDESSSAAGVSAGTATDTASTPDTASASTDYASDTTAAGGFGQDAGQDYAQQGTLAAEDRVVPQVDNAHPMSPDGRHWWDGEKWIDVSTDATSLHTAGLDSDAEQPAQASAEPDETVGTSTGWQGTDQEVPLAETTAISSYSEPEADTGVSPVQAVQASTPAQPERQLSPDGMWEWNGTQWVPAEQQAEPEPEPEPAAAAKPERQLSPDGHWEWDGTSWVPARKDDVAPVPAGAHVSPDGHWWWDGSQWLPTGR